MNHQGHEGPRRFRPQCLFLGFSFVKLRVLGGSCFWKLTLTLAYWTPATPSDYSPAHEPTNVSSSHRRRRSLSCPLPKIFRGQLQSRSCGHSEGNREAP